MDILRFVLSDTGIGMTEETCGRIFHPFEQADAPIAGEDSQISESDFDFCRIDWIMYSPVLGTRGILIPWAFFAEAVSHGNRDFSLISSYYSRS